MLRSDGGDKDQNGLRRVREESEKICRRNERGDTGGSGPQAKQANGDRLRGPQQGPGTCKTSDGKEGGVLAICAVRCSASSVRAGSV